LHIRVKSARKEAPTTVRFLRAFGGKRGHATLCSQKIKRPMIAPKPTNNPIIVADFQA
jgi:hypothetical protein